MKPEPQRIKPKFDLTKLTMSRAMMLGVALASAATMLLNAVINRDLSAQSSNAITPVRYVPHAPDYRAPHAVPVQSITQAEAKL